MLRKIFLFGIGVYLFLFIYAVLFYKERVLFCDAAYYLYNILKDDTFFIQHQRFGGVFGEVLAVIACKLGLPVAQIALSYSLSFVFFHFVVYLFTGLVLKEYKWALMILLGLVLYTTDGFYAPQSELPQGFTFFCLFMALLQKSRNVKYQLLAVACCMPFIVFFHPLLLFIIIYTACFFFLQKESLFTKGQLFMMAGAYILVMVIKLLFFRDKYEGETTGLGNFLRFFPNYYTPALHKFLLNCLVKYSWATIMFLVVIRNYYLDKAWKSLILTAGATIGYILLVHISHPFDDGLDFYMEALYMPLVVFIGLPFIFNVLPRFRPGQRMVFMLVILLAGVVRIYIAHNKYTTRLNWQREYLSQHRNQKLLVDANTVPKDILMITWASPYEFCLLSTVEHDATASINFNDNPDNFLHLLNKPKVFLHTWTGAPYSELRADRFKFRDTVSNYQVVK